MKTENEELKKDLANKLRDWLNSTGNTRQWLAAKLRVTVGTVNNWLSGKRGIPQGKAAAVEMLISSSEHNENDSLKKEIAQKGFSRAEIARELGVSILTVNNWLSAGRPIPPTKRRLIENLLKGENDRNIVKLSFSVAEYNLLMERFGDKSSLENVLKAFVYGCLYSSTAIFSANPD